MAYKIIKKTKDQYPRLIERKRRNFFLVNGFSLNTINYSKRTRGSTIATKASESTFPKSINKADKVSTPITTG